VTVEYRRYLALTQLQPEPVCPSPDVDAAWHLHITRTTDYARFCDAVFGRFLHHHPSRGGAAELERHRRMYAATQRAYARAFGQRPPAAVWPGVEERFAARDAAADEAAVWHLRGAWRRGATRVAAALAATVSGAFVLGISGALATLRDVPGPRYLAWAAAFLAAIALLAWLASRSPFVQRARPRDALDLYEAAWLAGGVDRMAVTAISTLVGRGVLGLPPASGKATLAGAAARLLVAPGSEEPLHPVERACLAGVRGRNLAFVSACQAIAPLAADTRTRLSAAGLAFDGRTMARWRLLATLAASAWLALALERVAHGFAVGRPVSLLVLLCVVDLALVLVLAGRTTGATSRGRSALRALRIRHDGHPAATAGRRVPRPRPGDAWLPLSIALFGASAAMAEPDLAGIGHVLGGERLRRGGDGGGGGGCSGGGGCGGGGCGGCGGG